MPIQQADGSWIHDPKVRNKLYYCDPAKNKDCPKSSCQDLCFHTFRREFGKFYEEDTQEEISAAAGDNNV